MERRGVHGPRRTGGRLQQCESTALFRRAPIRDHQPEAAQLVRVPDDPVYAAEGGGHYEAGTGLAPCAYTNCYIISGGLKHSDRTSSLSSSPPHFGSLKFEEEPQSRITTESYESAHTSTHARGSRSRTTKRDLPPRLSAVRVFGGLWSTLAKRRRLAAVLSKSRTWHDPRPCVLCFLQRPRRRRQR